ncbi:unnamed protein product [Lactuca saligna]|uniref:Arabidopsis retrotransposon Orf1 C-terminal domain-containing protein n=1 Tax=Lactuca saligna TaxID=75948 RepID=A0AA36EI10_LACSI|nr:unnamed protein product [Lactuca saligna]
MINLGTDDCLQQLFFNISWHDFLALSAHTYNQPTLEFLSTYAWGDTEEVLTFKLQGRQHRLKYDNLNTIIGIYDTHNTDIYSYQLTQFKSLPKVEFWTQITSLLNFNPSRKKDPYIIHPCWRISHRILSTSIFGCHEPGQINTVELYFLYCMTSRRWSCPGFATFFLDKCDIIHMKTTSDICIGGLITLIGLGVGLQFPESKYVPVDDPPLYLLDCLAHTRMELLVPINNRQYSWLNHVKQPVYTLHNISISAFTTSDHETWFFPKELHDDDVAEDDDEMQVDTGHAGSPFEAEDHYDLPIRQLPPPFYDQPSGAHFEPQHEYHSYQQHNEPEFPLDIYSQLGSLHLQGNQNTTVIRRIEEQQARASNYMDDLWYHFRPEGGYRPRGPPPP